MNIKQVLAMDEYQIFDRKSIHIAPTSLAALLCAFANADGGMVAIGISDKTKRVEGVDRMCRELNAIGLPDPVFNNNTFILKTTVHSAAYEKLAIEQQIVSDSAKNVAIEQQEVGDSFQKLPIDDENVAGSTQKLPIDEGNIADSPQKLPFSVYKEICQKSGYNEPTIRNLCRVYDFIEVNQIFSSSYIMKEMNCSERTSRNLMGRLREMNVVVPVKGRGKGQCRFKYKTEM